MAGFCVACAMEMGQPTDFAGECKPGYYALVTCEGCGWIQVDSTGRCVSMDCFRRHGKPDTTESGVAQTGPLSRAVRPQSDAVAALVYYTIETDKRARQRAPQLPLPEEWGEVVRMVRGLREK